jgi:hypothetical protein
MSPEDKIDLIAAVLAAGVVAGTAKSPLPASVAGVFRNIRKELLEKGFDEPKRVPGNPPEATGTSSETPKKPKTSKSEKINPFTGKKKGDWLK